MALMTDPLILALMVFALFPGSAFAGILISDAMAAAVTNMVPEIPAGAAPLVLVGATAAVFALRSWFKRPSK